MVMQTDLLGKLVRSGKRVAIIAPDKNDQNLVQYALKSGVELYEFNPSSNFWSANYAKGRMYFLENIRNNTALYEKHIYATEYTKYRHIWGWILPRVLMVVHDVKESIPAVKRWYQKREKKQLKSAEAMSILNLIDPKVVVSTYPVNFREGMLLEAAKNQGRKTIIHLLSWDNISCKGHFPTLADEYIAWGPIMQEELQRYYQVDKEKIHVCGVPHFDVHLESRKNPDPHPYLRELGLDPRKPYLLFGMSSPRFAPREIDIVEWLAKEIDKNTFGAEMQLVVRPHPQNVQGGMADESWLSRLKDLKRSRVAVDFPDLVESNMPWSMQDKDMIRLSHLLAGCSISLNSGSTLSIDALMCGVPVILTSFDGDEKLPYWRSARRLIDYPHLRKIAKENAILTSSSFENLTVVIRSFLGNRNLNIVSRNKLLSLHCGDQANGDATMRVIEVLAQIKA